MIQADIYFLITVSTSFNIDEALEAFLKVVGLGANPADYKRDPKIPVGLKVRKSVGSKTVLIKRRKRT